MAWDTAFNLTWAQRIEKEERSFLTGATAEKDAKAAARAAARGESSSPDRRRRRHSSRGSTSLTAAGDSMSRSPSSPSVFGSEASGSRSRLQTGSSSSSMRRANSVANIPEHLSAVAKFPVADKDLLTARVEPSPDGKVARVRFHPENVHAMWWPGRQCYTKFHPEFSFVDPPEWTPEDILKARPSRRQAPQRKTTSSS
mmetsp:Transcript_49525/g.111400  ORF Transcript_49525/g.111400 Transcript_49525/m.111400 type:complete len:199 (-) Transcript_49525:202-798(-)